MFGGCWLQGGRAAKLLVPDYEFERLDIARNPHWAEVARHGGYVMLRRRAPPAQ